VTAAAWLTALLLAFPSLAHRTCVRRRAGEIAAAAEAAARRHEVPVGLLLSVAVLESHLGCNPRSGGCWGAPISRTRRAVAGTADHAASALALGLRRCGSDEGAIAHFRWGHCRVPRGAHGYGPAQVLRLAERVARRMER
jgi:hypothetical protein